MIEAFEREQRELRVSRLVSLPEDRLEAILLDMNISLDDLDDVKAAVAGVGAIVTPQDAISATFQRADIRAQRYNTTDYPAFYTALCRDTCVAEISYHLNGSIAESGPRYYQFLEVTFSGEILELCGHQGNYPDLVSATDAGYPFCQSVAIEARQQGIHGLSAPSARHDGTCVPIFFEDAISNPEIKVSLRFTYENGAIRHEVLV